MNLLRFKYNKLLMTTLEGKSILIQQSLFLSLFAKLNTSPVEAMIIYINTQIISQKLL